MTTTSSRTVFMFVPWAVLACMIVLGVRFGAYPQVANAAPIDPPVKVACLMDKAATEDVSQVSNFGTSRGYPVEALVVEVQLSGIATIINLVVSDDDGASWTELSLNGSTGMLETGKLYTFATVICDTDQDGDALIYNIQFAADTTVDFLTLHRARVGSP